MAKRLKSSESLKRVIAGAQPQGGVTPGSEPAAPTRHCPPRPAKQTTPLSCPRSGALNGPHLPRGGATPGRGRAPSPAAPSRTGSFPARPRLTGSSPPTPGARHRRILLNGAAVQNSRPPQRPPRPRPPPAGREPPAPLQSGAGSRGESLSDLNTMAFQRP